MSEVKKNGVFVLPGIGRLVRAERKARTGRNPATGEAIKIPAKKVVKFRLAKSVKDAIVPPKKYRSEDQFLPSTSVTGRSWVTMRTGWIIPGLLWRTSMAFKKAGEITLPRYLNFPKEM